MLANRLLSFVFASALFCAWGVPVTFNLVPALGASGDEPAPFLTLDVAGATAAATSFIYLRNGDVYDFTGSVRFQGTKASDVSLISFSGEFDKDPFINWAITAVTGANSASFSYTFSTPVAPGIYSSALAGFSGSMGDLRGDGVSVTNLINTSEIASGTPQPALTMSGSCVAGPSTPASNHPCPPLGQFGPVSTNLAPAYYPSMSTTLKFTLTPNDSATFQGQLLLEQPTPEPGTVALMGFGLVGIVFGRYRQVRSRKPRA